MVKVKLPASACAMFSSKDTVIIYRMWTAGCLMMCSCSSGEPPLERWLQAFTNRQFWGLELLQFEGCYITSSQRDAHCHQSVDMHTKPWCFPSFELTITGFELGLEEKSSPGVFLKVQTGLTEIISEKKFLHFFKALCPKCIWIFVFLCFCVMEK